MRGHRWPGTPRRGVTATALAGAAGLLVTAVALTHLRIASIDLRYRLAAALRAEQRLLAQERSLAVELQQLRDPRRLVRIARERGFVPPEHVLTAPPGQGAEGASP